MKQHKMRRTIPVLLLSLGLLLGACGNAPRNDVSLADLSAAIESKIEDSGNLVSPGENYIRGSMNLDPQNLGEYVIKICSMGTNINEYGVFKAENETDAQSLAASLEAYLAERNEAWMPEYLPDQYPKLKDAAVKQNGVYVLYTILTDAERSAAEAAFLDMLKA